MPYVLWAIGVALASSLTLSTGIGAGVVYAPVLALGLGLDLEAAIATSLLIQTAGVGTTALSHHSARRIDLGLAMRLAFFAAAGFGVSRFVVDSASLVEVEVAYMVVMGLVGLWLLLGRRLPLPPQPERSRHSSERQAGDGTAYSFCRPSHGYTISAMAGAGTGLVGISGAEVQITALMIRCGVPPRIAVATGAATASMTLLLASLVLLPAVDWRFTAVGVPAAVLGSRLARRLSHRLRPDAMRVGIGVLALASAAGVGLRVLNGF